MDVHIDDVRCDERSERESMGRSTHSSSRTVGRITRAGSRFVHHTHTRIIFIYCKLLSHRALFFFFLYVIQHRSSLLFGFFLFLFVRCLLHLREQITNKWFRTRGGPCARVMKYMMFDDMLPVEGGDDGCISRPFGRSIIMTAPMRVGEGKFYKWLLSNCRADPHPF